MQDIILPIGKISENLRAALSAKGYSQNQLAEYANVSYVTISRYMKGGRIPGTEELFRMAQVLDVTMEYLLTGRQNIDSIWKTRAEEAERKLKHFKSMVVKLGDITHELTRMVSE